MASIGHIRRAARKAYKKRRNWRKVGEEMGITCGMAYRIAVDGYEPKDAKIRVRLGLPTMVPAPVCEKCGVVHVSKRCTAGARAARRSRDLWDLPVGVLRRMLEERVEV